MFHLKQRISWAHLLCRGIYIEGYLLNTAFYKEYGADVCTLESAVQTATWPIHRKNTVRL